ncbi:uncharacterized protein [Gossypium hirsutum]|uniref:Gag-Pol polyprotein n=1 Tax=Gossypium hirsutum TaxID=3635 RepID=A0A1U8JM19_GOSHI|nr:uncharacterized protein LOC107908332 [Gossypium hirsutum]
MPRSSSQCRTRVRDVIEYVPTEAYSCKRFLRGLPDELRVQLVYLKITEFEDLVERAKMVEQVLGLNKKPKNTRSFGKRSRATSSNPQSKRSKGSCGSWRSSFRSDRGRSGSFFRGSARRGSDVTTQKLEARVPGRAYVVWTHEEGDPHEVVTDLRSSHSYVNTKLVESGNIKSEMSRVSIAVSSPLGQTVLVDQVCRRCPLMIQNIIFPVDLLIMPFGDFDIILGMDRHSELGVILDCCKKKFIIQSENRDKIEVNGIRTNGSTRIIPSIQVNKLLHQGCVAFLAYVINSNSVESQCSKIRTVCEFPDVFPEEL